MLPDEVIRIRWIAEFRDEAKGLTGWYRRANEEYKKAQNEQRKNNLLTAKSAAESVRGIRQQDAERRAALTRFRQLSLEEERIQKRLARLTSERATAEARALRERERLLKQEKQLILDQEKARSRADQNILRAEKEVERQRTSISRERRKRAQDDEKYQIDLVMRRSEAEGASSAKEKQRIRQQINDIREQRQVRKTAHDERLRQLAQELEVLQQDVRAARVAARERDTSSRNEIRSGKERINVLRNEANDRHRLRLQELDDIGKTTRAQIQELEALRNRFQNVQGLVTGPGQAGRRIGLAERRLDQPFRIDEQRFGAFRRDLQEVARQAKETGAVSQASYDRMVASADRARVSTTEFKDATREAGFAIKNFHDEKTREIRVLRDNTRQMGDHNRVTTRAQGIIRGLSHAWRLTTNEMILFNRSLRLLSVPIMATAIGVLNQAVIGLTAAAAGAVSGLGPLAGEIAAIGPLALSTAQGFGVWALATKNLGKSTLDFTKIVQSSLFYSGEQFSNMFKDLTPAAAEFAITLRKEVYPGLSKLREQLSSNIFAGLINAFHSAKGTFAPLRGEFVQTSKIIQGTIEDLGKEVGSQKWSTDLALQAQRTNRWFRELRPAVLNIADAFRNITLAAGPLVDNLVTLTTRFSAWLKGWEQAQRQSGGFAAFFKETNYILGQTLGILGQFSKALLNIGVIAYKVVGRQIITDLNNAATAFNKWTTSASGQRSITRYFKDAKPAIYEMARLVRDLVVTMFKLGNQKEFFNLLHQLRVDVLPKIAQMLQTLTREFGPAFLKLIEAFVRMITTLAQQQGGLTRLVDALRLMANLMTAIAKSPIGPVLFSLFGFVAIFRTFRYAAAISGLTVIWRLIMGIGGAAIASARGVGTMNAALAQTGIVNRNLPTTIIPGAAPPPQAPITAFYQGARNRVSTFFGRGVSGPPPGVVSASAMPTPTYGGEFSVLPPGYFGGRQTSFRSRLGGAIGKYGGAVGLAGFVGGSILGGKAGGILQGAGLGASLGSVAGPWGVGIGAAVGGILGALRAFRGGLDATTKALTAAAVRLKEGRDAQKEARQRREDAQLGLKQATRSRVTAEAQQQALVTQLTGPGYHLSMEEIQKTDAYKDAHLAVIQALHDEKRAHEDLADAQKHEVEVGKTINDAVNTGLNEVNKKLQTARKHTRDLWGAVQDAASKTGLAWKSGANSVRAYGNTVENQLAALARTQAKLPAVNLPALRRTLGARIYIDTHGGRIPTPAQLNTFLKTHGKPIDLQVLQFLASAKRKDLIVQVKLQMSARDRQFLTGGALTVPIAPQAPGRRREGGYAPGPLGAGDVVPALLSPGEGVVTGHGQEMIDSVGGQGFFSHVMASQKPHFRAGGIVKRFQGGGTVPPLPIPGDPYASASEAFVTGVSSVGQIGGLGNLLGQLIGQGYFDAPSATKSAGSIKGRIANAPAAIKTALNKMINKAGSIDKADFPFITKTPKGGGIPVRNPSRPSVGWSKSQGKFVPGYDAAGAISSVLQAGTNTSSESAAGFRNWGLGGKGKWATVWAAPGDSGKVILDIAGQGFGLSRTNPDGGPGWLGGAVKNRSGMLARHWPGFRRGGYAGRRPSIGRVQKFQTGGIVGQIAQPGVGAASNVAFRNAMVRLANMLEHASYGFITAMIDSLRAAIESVRARLRAALASGNRKLAYRLDRQLTRLKAALDFTEAKAGERVGRILRQIEDLGLRIAQMDQTSLIALRKVGTLIRRQIKLMRDVIAKSIAAHADPETIRGYRQQLQELRNALRDQIRNIFSVRVAKAAFRTGKAELGLQRLELQQRIAGTYDTGGGQRASYITGTVVPALQGELKQLQVQLRRGRLTAQERRDKQLEIDAKRNEILQAQLDAQEAIKANTANINAQLRGNLSFEFGGQTETDLIGAGTGV